MVPVSSIVTMAIGAVIGIVTPFLLAWWLVKRYKVRPATITIGAGVFIVFALGLESILHQVVLKGPSGLKIMGNIWYYALYGGLAAGIFEETGRFLAMKYLLKKEPGTALTGVAYGIGHGGAELLLIFGITMVSNIVMSVMINTGQAESLLASAPAGALEQAQAQFEQLEASTPGTFLLGIWERVSALILQVGLSLIVWTGVRKGGKWLWLFPAAILLHFLADACVVLLAKSASMILVETILFCMALAVGAIGFMIAKKLKPSDEIRF